MKSVKLYKATNLALDVLRTALEVQFGKKIRHIETYLDIRQPMWHSSEEGRPAWESKDQYIEGSVLVGDKLMELADAHVELTSFGGHWHATRLFFGVRNPAKENGYNWYAAHCEYVLHAIPHERVLYPTLVRVSETHGGSENAVWRAGTGPSDVTSCPWYLDTYLKHPALHATSSQKS